MADNSLMNFLKEARPAWRSSLLKAVAEKLEKVGVRDVSELLVALRAPEQESLNSRLQAVGERCFTLETLQAFQQHFQESSQLHLTLEISDVEDDGAITAKLPSPPPPLPASKEDMKSFLADLGLELKGKCQARELRAMLVEAHRCRYLSRADLLAECRGRFGLDAAVAAASSCETLVRYLITNTYPNSVSIVDLSELELAKEDDDDDDDEISFEVVTERPEPLSLSTFHSTSTSIEELWAKCESAGFPSSEVESRGLLALKLKSSSRKAHLQSLKASVVS
eukprot:TRINITY_DN2745_c0_g2_i2.p1 TRINITY_DN2745_c0_g2~~TRINITY_DN2745_c0_g2_i2.p1  ORF type:complete len:292 (-),score=61.63 TRINITY_DN2745_c0_g2_i2:98-940(-)